MRSDVSNKRDKSHAENQKSAGFVKVFAIKNSNPKVFRPEEQIANYTTGKHYGGSDTYLELVVPDSVNAIDTSNLFGIFKSFST